MKIPFQSELASLMVGITLGGYIGGKLFFAAKKRAELKMVKQELYLVKSKAEIRETLIETKDSLLKDYNITILRQVNEINGYANANSNLAQSRTGTREIIYRQSAQLAAKEIKNDPKNPINYCLAIRVNERMLSISNAYRTGFPSQVSTIGEYVLAGD